MEIESKIVYPNLPVKRDYVYVNSNQEARSKFPESAQRWFEAVVNKTFKLRTSIQTDLPSGFLNTQKAFESMAQEKLEAQTSRADVYCNVMYDNASTATTIYYPNLPNRERYSIVGWCIPPSAEEDILKWMRQLQAGPFPSSYAEAFKQSEAKVIEKSRAENPEAFDALVKSFETGAVRSNEADIYRFDLISPIAMLRLAQTYKEGYDKYGANNWQKGFPIGDILNHALAHIFSYLAGDRSEDHLAHAMWNMGCAMHMEIMKPELDHELVQPLPNGELQRIKDWIKTHYPLPIPPQKG